LVNVLQCLLCSVFHNVASSHHALPPPRGAPRRFERTD